MFDLAVIGCAISGALVLYVYVGYPLVARLLAGLLRRGVRHEKITPPVSILIAAYNEADCIEQTLRNKLEQDYPQDLVEILVISDASDDGTDEIVKRFDADNVRLLRQEPRAGKTSALNLAVAEASGEILLFADANSLWAPDAVRTLVSNFADAGVGYVTGKMVYFDPTCSNVGEGCSAYMRYENWIRAQETGIGSVVGVDGGIDACRRELFVPMRADQLPDFVLPLQVVRQGYRVVYEPRAVLREPTLGKTADEYRMRVRVALRALWAMRDMVGLFHPTRHGLFAWQLLSHKLLRYLVVVFLVVFGVCSGLLATSHCLFGGLAAAQIAWYGVSALVYLREARGESARMFFPVYYFTILNLAAGHACLKFLRGEKQVIWNPRGG